MPSREAGEVLGGKYRLVNRLGTGGMGSVWRAEHLTLTSPVAIKLIEPTTARESDALHRFLREARTAAALRSPHVVQILDYGLDGDSPFIVMELLDGESLAERLDRQTRLGVSETARVIQHISRALGRAHEAGIVHRDLKPENVFIVRNDDEEVAKVLDFGIVKADPNTFGTANSGAATRTGTLLGTPYFMSPEQAEGDKSVDFRADIWALGVIAYRCLLGRLPFTGDSVGRLILEICSRPLPVPSHRGPVPEGFDTWFARACAREPGDRFESAKRASAELSRLTDELSSSSPETPRPPEPHPLALATTTLKSSSTEVLPPPSSTEVLPPPRQRLRPLALALAAVAAVSLATTITVQVVRTAKGGDRAPPLAQVVERRAALEAARSATGAAAASPPAAEAAPPASRWPSAHAAQQTVTSPAATPAPEVAAPLGAPAARAESTPSDAPASPAAGNSSAASSWREAPVTRRSGPTKTGAASPDDLDAPSRATLVKPPVRARKPPERKPPERKPQQDAPSRPKIDLGI